MSSHCEPEAPRAEVAVGRPLLALVGNPNTGKTTLFNRLTGQNARVGNYPGITVDRRVGSMRLHKVITGEAAREVDVLDVPGAYSLSARSAEEQIAIDAVLGLHGNPTPALMLVLLDINQVGRNLYLALQLMELGLPVLLILNMADEAGDDPPDPGAITALFGVPCLKVSARTNQGIVELKRAVHEALKNPPISEIQVDYPRDLDADVAAVEAQIPADWGEGARLRRALALWALTSLDEEDELRGIPSELRAVVAERLALAHAAERDTDGEIIGARYSLLDAHHAELRKPPAPRTWTGRLDRVLLHPVAGFVVFLLIMLTMFQALFTGADPLIGVIETGVEALGNALTAVLPSGVLTDLLVQGIVGGVGNVVVFLPQILLLFLFIGVLEDSGYMARAAYLMDRIMRALGLHGRAFVPMLSGFACAVPAIMATRTMERERDRILTMMVVPLMTCSARLPVYTLIIAALFPPDRIFGVMPVQGLLMMAMYLFSVLIALIAAGVLGRTVLKGVKVPLILELPPYRMPTMKSTARLMADRGKSFLKEAGTVILACTVLMWGLLTFPRAPLPEGGMAALSSEQVTAFEAEQIQHSYAGQLGHAIEPAIRPLGFDWKIGVGIVGAFAAREVFVSTMGLVYGIGGDVDEESTSLREKLRTEAHEDGRPVYTPLMGLSLMVFFALACQCMSTLAIVKRETRGWKWPAFLFVYMTTLAWVASFVIYQGGMLLGFG